MYGWISEGERWSEYCVLIGYLSGKDKPFLACPLTAGSPALSCKKKKILFFHIINPLLSKLFLLRWLNICFTSFLRFYWPWIHFSVHKNPRIHKNSAHIKPSWPHAWSISRLIYPTVTFMIYEFQCNGDARHFDGIFMCDKPWPFPQYSSFEDHYFFSVIIDCLVDLYATAGR